METMQTEDAVRQALAAARAGNAAPLRYVLDALRHRRYTWQRSFDLFCRYDQRQPPLDAAEFDELCYEADRLPA